MPIGRSRRSFSTPPAPRGEVVSFAAGSWGQLAVEVREPSGPAQGTAILLHSTMASRRIFNSPREQGLATLLNDNRLRTLALDFRGHGDSGPNARQGGVWTFDDFVREDVPALCRAARDRWPEDKLTLVGHSLGGQAAIASVATGLADADAIVVLSTNVWLPSDESNPVLRAKKAAIVRFCGLTTRARGYFPARALGFGSDDEAAAYMAAWTRFWTRDRWTNEDLGIDYLEAMSRLRVPLLSISSLGDDCFCTPPCAARFVLRAPRERTTFELVRRADDGGPPPPHMELVTTRAAASFWQRAADFCKA